MKYDVKTEDFCFLFCAELLRCSRAPDAHLVRFRGNNSVTGQLPNRCEEIQKQLLLVAVEMKKKETGNDYEPS